MGDVRPAWLQERRIRAHLDLIQSSNREMMKSSISKQNYAQDSKLCQMNKFCTKISNSAWWCTCRNNSTSKQFFFNFFLVTESEGNSIFSAEICTAFFFFFFFSKERRKVSQKWHLVKIRRAAGSRDARSGISSQISPIVLKPIMRL